MEGKLSRIAPYGSQNEAVGRFGRFFFITKSYFLQVKSLVLVGILGKICVLDSYYFNSTCGVALQA
ncbi:hypothetical protein B1H38_08350 [Leptospira borgpetersenii serovar Ballum]|nr:hypothetical protein B1H38_08350 [Leptospira borgpetersenii serovar Ballum]